MQDPPRFFDVQVNGYVGKDFNDERLTADDWHFACQRMQDDGLIGILATVVTDEIDAMSTRLARIVRAREQDPLVRDLVRGIHIEGPFLSAEPGYIGAHPLQHVRPPTLDAMRLLLDAAAGLTCIVTLAPEYDKGFRVIQYLANHGLVVAAGHCNPSLDQLRAAIDAGLSMFTHLGNGCPMQMHRHDNIIQRVLSLTDRLWISFIGDGTHVPYHALQNYLRCAAPERVVITTDAMAVAGLPPGRYDLRIRTVEFGEDFAVWGPEKAHLIGGAMTMPQLEKRLRQHLGLDDSELRSLLCDNAAHLLSSTNNERQTRPLLARYPAVLT